MKFYLVTCERGHCGKGNCSYIKFAFEADNMMAAVDMARSMPSVKHTRLCTAAKEITYEEYIEYRKVNAYDRYDMRSSPRKRVWYGRRH